MANRLALLSLLVIPLVGCGSSETPTDATATTAPGASSTGNTTVKNAPDTSASPGASYQIKPANPSDPKYKADPRLAGGG